MLAGVVGDLFEAVGLVVAAPGEHLDVGILQMNLHAVAIELDRVHPAVTGRQPLDRCRQHGLDEVRDWLLLGADRRRLLALECHLRPGAWAAATGCRDSDPRSGR